MNTLFESWLAAFSMIYHYPYTVYVPIRDACLAIMTAFLVIFGGLLLILLSLFGMFKPCGVVLDRARAWSTDRQIAKTLEDVQDLEQRIVAEAMKDAKDPD